MGLESLSAEEHNSGGCIWISLSPRCDYKLQADFHTYKAIRGSVTMKMLNHTETLRAYQSRTSIYRIAFAQPAKQLLFLS